MTSKKANRSMKETPKQHKRINHGFVRRAPYVLQGVIVAFLLASLVLGELFGAYVAFWWWDDMLHTLSGVILGLIGFLLVYFFNARYNMHISPVFVALFAFSFAVTTGAFWEIIEFSIDVGFGTAMQRWNLPTDAILIGKDYQGTGLRDTMSDLIVTSIGALMSSSLAYYAYKHEKPTSLRLMRRVVGRFRK